MLLLVMLLYVGMGGGGGGRGGSGGGGYSNVWNAVEDVKLISENMAFKLNVMCCDCCCIMSICILKNVYIYYAFCFSSSALGRVREGRDD